jgi:hypothetical protein
MKNRWEEDYPLTGLRVQWTTGWRIRTGLVCSGPFMPFSGQAAGGFELGNRLR